MTLDSITELPWMAISGAKSAGYIFENRLLFLLSKAVPGQRPQTLEPDPSLIPKVRKELLEALRQDALNIKNGVYPFPVLKPGSPFQHARRLPRLLWDSLRIAARRNSGRTSEFNAKSKELLSELPRYYRRNFHFQSNGYLSRESAELYDHQVDILFSGATDAMRRLIIAPLRERFGNGDGKGLTFLEIGTGTGRSTQFVHQAFPRAKIIAVDLSEPYLKYAQEKLLKMDHVHFLQADGAHLPFQEKQFDAVYSVFLFHELPMKARLAVLEESKRVLKPGGFMGAVDSIQKGDKKDFDPLLEQFPRVFHEPFYRNYIENPLEELMSRHADGDVKVNSSFFSKACWAN